MRRASPDLFIALGLLLLLTGCPASREQASAGGESESERLDRLRSLPYAAFSKEVAAEARSGATLHDPGRYCPGYNLHINQFLCFAELTDRDGRVVNSWSHEPCHHWENGILLPDGDFVVTALGVIDEREFKEQSIREGYLLRMSWGGEVVWKKPIPAHHDVAIAPDGNLLTLSSRYRRERSVHAGLDVVDNLVVLLSPEGNPIGEISLFDILRSPGSGFTLEKSAVKIKPNKRWVDLLHVNSVEWMDDAALAARDPIYGLDNILVTSRHQDVAAIINWRTKELVWSWGKGEMLGPHDATVLENGRILVFDNGLGRGWSRAIEVDPLTREIVWEYKAADPEDLYTRSRGGSQRLPNGNTLLTVSNSGRAIEVTRDGRIVWEYCNPHVDEEGHRATIFRMERYEPVFIDSLRKRFGGRSGSAAEGGRPPRARGVPASR